MTRLLGLAIRGEARKLPPDARTRSAQMLLWDAGEREFRVDPDAMTKPSLLLKKVSQANRGEFATDADMAALETPRSMIVRYTRRAHTIWWKFSTTLKKRSPARRPALSSSDQRAIDTIGDNRPRRSANGSGQRGNAVWPLLRISSTGPSKGTKLGPIHVRQRASHGGVRLSGESRQSSRTTCFARMTMAGMNAAASIFWVQIGAPLSQGPAANNERAEAERRCPNPPRPPPGSRAAAARRAAPPAPSGRRVSIPYITRNIPLTEMLERGGARRSSSTTPRRCSRRSASSSATIRARSSCLRGAGCDIKGERVRFPRGLARKLCATTPSQLRAARAQPRAQRRRSAATRRSSRRTTARPSSTISTRAAATARSRTSGTS